MTDLLQKRLYLLDMDGTLYLGNRLFEGTMEFLETIRALGGRYLFMTNNSSKSVKDYVNKLNALGIQADDKDFITSAQATALYLKERYAGKKIYVLGTDSLKQEFEKEGLMITDRLEDDIVCLAMGFDTELHFKKLEDACKILKNPVGYVATNPDWVCPTEYGYVPDCGSVSQMLYNATKKTPVFIGKPEPAMAELAMSKTGYDKGQTIVIGDRLYTDIACGIRAGIGTALVLSGETCLADLEESEHKPDYVFRDVTEITRILKEGLVDKHER